MTQVDGRADDSRTLRRAVTAGADLVLEAPVALPPLPSSSSLCRALGVGASTFHRLFGNTEGFHQAFLEQYWSLRYDHDSSQMTEATAADVDRLPDIEDDFGFLAATIFAALYWGDLSEPTIPEAVLYPWLDNPVVSAAVVENTTKAVTVEAGGIARFGVLKGVSPETAEAVATPVVTTVAMSNLAVRLVTDTNGVAWPVAEFARPLSTLELTFARTAAAYFRAYLSERDSRV